MKYLHIDNNNRVVGVSDNKVYNDNYTLLAVDDDDERITSHINNVNEYIKLTEWFISEYSKLEQKYRRLHTLGKTTDEGKNAYDELVKLYQIAEQNRQRIQELEVILGY